jgi:hypothetical protein
VLPDSTEVVLDWVDYWRICDELSIIEAALLMVGCDPTKARGYVDTDSIEFRPHGYEAAKTALVHAIQGGRLKARIVMTTKREHNPVTNGYIDVETDVLNRHKTTIEVEVLRSWLAGRGVHAGFFFPQSVDMPDYLDPKHPSYAPKMVAAIRAWQAVNTDPKYHDKGRSVKQNIESWLEAHAAEYGLVKDDGTINQDAIKNQIAKVANWQTIGGAPKTPGS